MVSVLYRAKRKDNSEWVKGYYVKTRVRNPLGYRTAHFIIPEDATVYSYDNFDEYVEIIPETVCRLLEYACWDGDLEYECRSIYQNDIIAVWWNRKGAQDRTEPDDIALVVDETTILVAGRGRWFPQDTTSVRIIGNAYDNPELLKGHNMNHFVTRLREYPGDADEYTAQHRYLTNKYGIHGAQACCYMCNFENDYICHQYNGGCSRFDICSSIREHESKEEE